MKLTNSEESLQKTRFSFGINLILCAISLIILFYSIEGQENWRIAASSAGFIWFLSATILVFRQMKKLENEAVEN